MKANQTISNTDNQFDWMKEVGVPATEIIWLKSMVGSEKLKHPVAARRLQDIHEIAYASIVNKSKHSLQ